MGMLAVRAKPAARSFGILAAEYPDGADETVFVTIAYAEEPPLFRHPPDPQAFSHL